MAPCMGPMSPILAHSLWVGLVSRKAGKTETKTKAGKTLASSRLTSDWSFTRLLFANIIVILLTNR